MQCGLKTQNSWIANYCCTEAMFSRGMCDILNISPPLLSLIAPSLPRAILSKAAVTECTNLHRTGNSNGLDCAHKHTQDRFVQKK